MKMVVKIVEISGCIGWEEACDLVAKLRKERGLDEDDETYNELSDNIDKELETWIEDGDTIYIEFDLEKKKARVLTLEEYKAL